MHRISHHLTHRCVGHTAWASKGRKGQSQAGLKGGQLEVGAQRSPRLLEVISYITDIAVELIYWCVILDIRITRVSNNKLWSFYDDHVMVVFFLGKAIYCAWKNFYEDGKSCESYKWQNSENNELINIGLYILNLKHERSWIIRFQNR